MLATRTLCRCTLSTSKTACSTTSGRCCGCSLSCVRHAHSTRLHTHHAQNNMLYRQRTMLCERACRLFVDHANSVIWTHSRTAKNLLHNQRTMLCESRLSVVCLPRELCAAAHSPYAKQHAVQTADNALSEQLVGCLSTTRTLRCWTHSPAKQLAPHPADNAL